jgi:DNA-directed RNA polymerase subunit RPC12/RpoP
MSKDMKDYIQCPDCSHPMIEWREGIHPSGETRPRVRCKHCRRWKWKI